MKKRILSMALLLTMLLSLLPTGALAAGTTATAVPSPTKLTVNGTPVSIDAYVINQNNYIKLRDMAYLINGTAKNFEVKWDGAKNAINLLSKTAYTPTAGDMAAGDGQSKSATLSTSAIYVDGVVKPLTAYVLGGNNYFKLRDVMQAFDVYVGYADGTATLDTTKGYEVPPAPATPVTGLSTKAVTGKYEMGNNLLHHDYIRANGTYAGIESQRWARPVASHLVQTADGRFLRVERKAATPEEAAAVVVEQYDKELKLLSQTRIDNELPLYGGFYAGSTAYFLFYGQLNPLEDDTLETFRLVKYDKDWNRLGQVSMRNTDTSTPFEGASVSMVETGGQLYIHTAHAMYTAADGLQHQANLTFAVDIAGMTLSGMSSYAIMFASGKSDGAWAGHSFNQLAATADGIVVTADQCDANPNRAMQISKRNLSDISKNNAYASVLPLAGRKGENFTAAQLGGLAISSTSILTVGSTADQSTADATKRDQYHHNIYLTATPRDNLSGTTKVTYLTNYPKGSIAAGNPFLVALGQDRFMLLWNERPASKDSRIGYLYTDNASNDAPVLCYTYLDGSGAQLGAIVKTRAYLSDCQPILTANGNVMWYTRNMGNLNFHTITPGDLSALTPVAPGTGADTAV